MSLNQNEKSAFEAVWQLVVLSDIKLTQTSLKNALLQHHDFPTLAAFGDVLDEFNIPNLSTRLTPENLSEIPLPAIAHLDDDDDGGSFVVIKKVSSDKIEWQNGSKSIQKSITEFAEKWSGVTLLIEPSENSGEAHYQELRRNEIINNLRIPFVVTGLVICFLLIFLPTLKDFSISTNWQYFALLFTKILGVTVSVMLVWYSIDAKNPFLANICHINKKTNCENILNSKAAKIFGWLSWSEIGLFYFVGGFLMLLINPNSLEILGFLAILALPYTFWSVYYQAFVAKEWCPLCLGVQALLWVEFLLLFFTYNITFSLTELPVRSLIIAFLPTPILWAFIKNPLLKSYLSDQYKNEFQKLKFNPDFMESLMSNETFLPPITVDMKVITMGNPLAENKLTVVLNPICGGCKRTFGMLEKLLETDENINCHIILVASPDGKSESSLITQNIFNEHSNNLMLKALQAWFGTGLPPQKGEKYPAEAIIVEAHRKWYTQTGQSKVPLIFLNNAEIPSIYEPTEFPKLFRQYKNVGFQNQQ